MSFQPDITPTATAAQRFQTAIQSEASEALKNVSLASASASKWTRIAGVMVVVVIGVAVVGAGFLLNITSKQRNGKTVTPKLTNDAYNCGVVQLLTCIGGFIGLLVVAILMGRELGKGKNVADAALQDLQ